MRNLLPWSVALILGVSLFTDLRAQSPAPTQKPSAQPAPSAQQVMLAPGDSIRISVWRKPEMSGDFIVGPDGTITHPLYQAVRVGGIPFSTAEVNLRNFLLRFEQD